MHACRYDACIYDAAEILSPTNKQGNSKSCSQRLSLRSAFGNVFIATTQGKTDVMLCINGILAGLEFIEIFGGEGNVSIEIIFRNGCLCIISSLVPQPTCCWKRLFPSQIETLSNHIRVSKVVRLSMNAKCPLSGA